MSRIRTAGTIFAAVFVVALYVIPMASADSFQAIYQDYSKTGKIDACKYTAKQLQDARKQVPGDIAQYAPDFPDALDAAAQQRASGGCSKSSKTTTTAAAGTTGGDGTTTPGLGTTTTPPVGATGATGPTGVVAPGGSTPQPAASATPTPAATLPDATLASSTKQTGDGKTPIPLVLLALLGGLALIGGSFAGAMRWWAFDPPWLARTRHSVAEAGWRASAAWAEFTDWIRFGR